MMETSLTSLTHSFRIGSATLPHRLLQGPLAGFSAAPMRLSYNQFLPPAYCVSEMISAFDILHKHTPETRYLYRSPEEKILCYQLAGHDPQVMASAAVRLESMGADLIDLNCGCPKAKIRKKKAGSALLDSPDVLCDIISTVRDAIQIPLSVKIRIFGDERDFILAKAIEDAGADALIVHGRRWIDDYDIPCDWPQINKIKQMLRIPVIANGDISDKNTLEKAMAIADCDAYMIARAGCGQPWLYQQLLGDPPDLTHDLRLACFMQHLHGLATLESEFQAILQSKKLVRYYFRDTLSSPQLQAYYALNSLKEVERFLS
jgi:tRNA-dihydrouridine synthase B